MGSGFVQNINIKVKSSTSGVFVFFIKFLSGLMIGLTLALIGQEIIGYETLSFVLFIVVFTGVFLKKVRSWGLLGIFALDLICILIALLLRMYIIVAPGA